PVGNLEIVTDGEVVTQLEYLYQYTHLRFSTNHELYILKKVKRWLDDYFLGNNPEIDFLLQPHGTSFQQEVWAYLNTIPY
ncbi:methylated-DNA--[protein]-cysteine S-methyltransferase, partial [Staphylococcus capitis]